MDTLRKKAKSFIQTEEKTATQKEDVIGTTNDVTNELQKIHD
jgi:hypothetical protein